MFIQLVKRLGYAFVATLTLYLAFFEFETVLKEIDEDFTAEERERLFQILAKKRIQDRRREARKRISIMQVEELWAMLPEGGVNITDEELDEMKVQWRMEKYG